MPKTARDDSLRVLAAERYNRLVHLRGTNLTKITPRIIAAALLVFMLAEWGSHAMVHISLTGEAAAVVADQHRDDPCHILVCSDSRRHERQMPGMSHDLMPIVSLSRVCAAILPVARAAEVRLPTLRTANLSSRPPDPHFRPPEIA